MKVGNSIKICFGRHLDGYGWGLKLEGLKIGHDIIDDQLLPRLLKIGNLGGNW